MDPRRLPAHAINAGRAFVNRHPRLKRRLRLLLAPFIGALRARPVGIAAADYRSWIAAHDTLDATDRAAIRAAVARMPARPRFSVLLAAPPGTDAALGATVAALRAQLHPDWELLCPGTDAAIAEGSRLIPAAEDGGPPPSPRPSPTPWERESRCGAAGTPFHTERERGRAGAAGPPSSVERERVGVRVGRPAPAAVGTRQTTDAGDSADAAPAAVNRALAQATGDWVLLLDAGDLLPEQALHEFAAAIAAHPDAQVIYADEDRLDAAAGRRADPWFKPDFDPELLLAWNYPGRPVAFRRDLLAQLGGLRPGFGAAAEHDLMLRATAAAGAARVRHIPAVLCHRRPIAAAAPAPDGAGADDASRRAVRAHLAAAQGIAAPVEPAPLAADRHRIRWPRPDPLPLVSVIVPTRDRAALLERCLDGLLHRTAYAPLEVLVVDNGSEEAATHALFDRLRRDPRLRILPAPGPFNFAALNNRAAAEARGEILLLLNNDIDVIAPDWLAEMVACAVRPEVGAVGARLLYANGRLQHGGTVLGIGVADHLLTGSRRDDPGPQGLLAAARSASAVTAACLALRRSVYEAVGGMDAENLAVAFNDVDLCLRIGAALGLRVVWTPFAELHHLESASRGVDLTGAKAERFRREEAYMQARWGALLRADPYWNPNLSLADAARNLAWPPRREKPWRRQHPLP